MSNTLPNEEDAKKAGENRIYFDTIFNQSIENWRSAYKRMIESKINAQSLREYLFNSALATTIDVATGFNPVVQFFTDQLFPKAEQFTKADIEGSDAYKKFKEESPNFGQPPGRPLTDEEIKSAEKYIKAFIDEWLNFSERKREAKFINEVELMRQKNIQMVHQNAQQINAISENMDGNKIKEECFNQLKRIKEALPLNEQEKFNNDIIEPLSDKNKIPAEILRETMKIQSNFIASTERFVKGNELKTTQENRLRDAKESLAQGVKTGGPSDFSGYKPSGFTSALKGQLPVEPQKTILPVEPQGPPPEKPESDKLKRK